MPDYEKGCIYMIKHKLDFNNENVYIGSCCNFTRRKSQHKHSCNIPNNKKYNFKLYQKIREKDGWDCWIMIKLHEYKCKSKYELNLEERRVIDEYKAKLNYQLPTRRYDEYYKDNRDKILKRVKKYSEGKEENKANYDKEYREKNKEKLAEQKKKYSEENRDKILEGKKEWYKNNKEQIAEKRKEIIKCDNCGSEITKNNFLRHKTTKKCLNY